ncbi:calcium/calmodulin-regulated receptor-like kinase 2 isoform X2 [Vitis vinifera]|uniref:calcium/calmodulin-regulated receptor-like kinase 2 isoform X2 n=1 Tax=Vitis vinifera TaxID=29760 RepID=UPI0008FEBC6E|nr:calcium/calmodulin-regulated receptor-like kinase 2 isoform X2 [Vitis vinifera]|eukprot:XP_019080561.1 PREDICTED: calcium/calmodulin-regulated receptor-like kinase 2 isoform X1 [Vitis vinifera]
MNCSPLFLSLFFSMRSHAAETVVMFWTHEPTEKSWVLGWWYKKHSHLRRCANERCSTALPIRTNGLDASIDSSASVSNSIAIPGSEFPAKDSHLFWWSHRHDKDQLASASGIPRYSYKDIQKATHNFTTILGQGSFGPVYKATMATGGVVAVKVLASNSKQGEKEFQTEVSLLGRLHHRNLVNLVGYCVDKGQHMLIYEFMSNGSLENLLYSEEGQGLSWEERLQIALDISHGIEYLHEGAVPPVIHRDLKSANILLDQSMRAKVADFGLSKEEVFDGRNSGLKGTYGYIDPAYISSNKFTMKSDIYSFGVIIFELITAIHPHQNLMEFVNLAAMSPDGADEILDKQLVGECKLEEVRTLASIGHKCLHKTPRKRPSIGEVSLAIARIKQRRFAKEHTMSLADSDLSRMVSRIENQQVELFEIASFKDKATE